MTIPRPIQQSEFVWTIDAVGPMRLPAKLYASARLMQDMEDKVFEQLANVATLPGIVQASLAMPDAHWGYGFPIGGVAACDPQQGGVISAGGVGFDIACGVRTLLTFLHEDDIRPKSKELADLLFQTIPAGVGSTGKIRLSKKDLKAMLTEGGKWAVAKGYGSKQDLIRTEERGCMAGARVECVSEIAQKRQRDEMGTLGSGNHYLEVQVVREIYDETIGDVFGLRRGDVVVSIHCGSRGLGHQIGTDFMQAMKQAGAKQKISFPDPELVYAPLFSQTGQDYLGAMRAGINCALANRQIIMHLVREVFDQVYPGKHLPLLFDVSHNTCKEEVHEVKGKKKNLFVHRKGATRAYGPGHPSLPQEYVTTGQPVIIGGSMGTSSYILAGTKTGESLSFSSACHGAGRVLSRRQAMKRWKGKDVISLLESKGVTIRGHSFRGLAEEAPNAYKDVDEVVEVSHRAGLAKKVARLEPMICIKG